MKNSVTGVLGTITAPKTIGHSIFSKKTEGVSRTSLKNLLAIPTTCNQCPAGCGILAYLNGNRLVQILGNPYHPNNKGSICAKGIAGINLVYDPERLLYPMKRIGPRGSGKWTRITWDEVYLTLSSRITSLIKDGRENEFVADIGEKDRLLENFVTSLKSAKIIDRNHQKNINLSNTLAIMTGSPSLIEDVGRSRLIVNFGANPYANHDRFLGIAQRMVQSQVENGTKLYTFDVRMSETAAKSDIWYPIRAGTDGFVALAMARVILYEGLADENLIKEKTNVISALLKAHLKKYTPELAERVSGVKAGNIIKLAREFATQKPSIAMIGGGIYDHENGSQNVRCVTLLNTIIGNFEQNGGLFFPRTLNTQTESQNEQSSEINGISGIQELEEVNSRIDTYFVYLSNPAYSEPDCKSAEHYLRDEDKVGFITVMDTHLTETASFADMVLPAATFLESWELSSSPSFEKIPVLNLRQPVVSLLSDAQVLRSPAFDVGKLLEPSFRPLGDAKEIGNVCLELTRRIGAGFIKQSPFTNTQDYIDNTISSIQKTEGLKTLKEKGFWSSSQIIRTDPRNRKKVFILSIPLDRQGHFLLPVYNPIPTHRNKQKSEFILTAFKSNLWSRGTRNSKWIREILHENRLWINKNEASKLGIKNGDKVRILSSAGTITTRVLTTNRIHPESVALAEGLGHTAVGKIAQAKRFKSKDSDTLLIWWDKKGNGVNPNEIIERHKDPVSGGNGLKDTVVRIEKIEKKRKA